MIRTALSLWLLLTGLSNRDVVQSTRNSKRHNSPQIPIVINTWAFTDATAAAWTTLQTNGATALDAVERGCSQCEEAQCDGSVGYGGSPDDMGQTSLDALVMDGDTLEVGAVGNIRHIKQATKAARAVLEHTTHTLLTGLQASQFAEMMGLAPANLTTEKSAQQHKEWHDKDCQPNFRRNVSPDPRKMCGPYTPDPMSSSSSNPRPAWAVPGVAHDTISMVVIDSSGSMAAACSTNGAIHKVAGRVGDGAIAGGGAYVDSAVGGCGATGDGDAHLRFLPCLLVVESMRQGVAPREAAEAAVRRIAERVEGYVGAVFAIDKDGNHGAACFGWEFSYAYRDSQLDEVQVVRVKPLEEVEFKGRKKR